jgi:hypothetical protein
MTFVGMTSGHRRQVVTGGEGTSGAGYDGASDFIIVLDVLEGVPE